jgi:hypothetical protein
MRASWLLALAPLAACGNDAASSDAGIDGPCLADPIPHEVHVDNCKDDTDCPSGTACDITTCRVVTARGGHEFDLITGFAVASMSATRTPATEEQDAVVTWRAPMGTRVVQCALFRCTPDVGRPDGATTGPRRILNYDSCVVLEHNTSGTNGAFDLGFPYDDPVPGDPECESSLGVPAITDLVAGCWAYSDTELIAATPLVAIPPGEVDLGEVPDEAACTRDFIECYDEQNDRFGTCFKGRCAQRCLGNADCIVPSQDADAGAVMIGVCQWQREEYLVGACDV